MSSIPMVPNGAARLVVALADVARNRALEAAQAGGGNAADLAAERAERAQAGAANKAATRAFFANKRRAEAETRPAAPARRVVVVSPTELEGRPIPDRQWIVPDWLPVGCVTLLYGAGGLGKTLLAQQLLTCCATGQDWLGQPTTPCVAIGLFGEDDNDELHRRQAMINATLGVTFRDLQNMSWASGAGLEITLASRGEDGFGATEFCATLRDWIATSGAKLVVIDNIATTFDGNEINRTEVHAFIGRILTSIALDMGCAILLLGHPSKEGGKADGDQTSGSTGWNAAARSRWSLQHPVCPPGATPNPNERILKKLKANYARTDASIALSWHQGAFVAPGAGLVAAMGDAAARAEAVFLDLLRQHIEADIPLSHSKSATNFAAAVFAAHPGRQGCTKTQFARALTALQARGAVRIETYGKASNPHRRLVLAGSGDGDAAEGETQPADADGEGLPSDDDTEGDGEEGAAE
jgi:hypothetical protein